MTYAVKFLNISINKKEKYLVTGTPCQIDSFRKYIKKFRVEDNFVLMDFFCHGVPSKLVWDKYITEKEKTFLKKSRKAPAFFKRK